MLRQYANIDSQLDALKIKEIEKVFYERIKEDVKIVPKVTPFKGINTDMLYIKDNKLLFIKFMDTTEDLFFLLEEELIEVMKEEYDLFKIKMQQHYKDINYEYVFIMPYVDIEDTYGYDDFVYNNIIDKTKVDLIIEDIEKIDEYISDDNNEIKLNLFLLDVCPEYYTISNICNENSYFKKISFVDKSNDNEYNAVMLESEQIKNCIDIKYENTVYKGASGTGKTTLMLSKAIKLARVYPHHNFLIFTSTKQLRNELREKLQLLYKDNNNLEVHTFNSFLLKLGKKYNLIVDYSLLKNHYDKTIKNIIKQANNIIKNKNMFKGIFIDEAEGFKKYEIEFIEQFLYKSKYIFNLYTCEYQDITNDVNIFHDKLAYINYENEVVLDDNYRQSKSIVDFSNNIIINYQEYIEKLRPKVKQNGIYCSKSRIDNKKSVDIIKVSDLEEQISSVIWEIDYLINKKGLSLSDIAIVYPFNKKTLKNGKTIYFQYMLKKELEDSEISYIQADESLTNLSKKTGVTISNIYNIKNLEYKAIILCELEMLYNHTIADKNQDYQINDFRGDINKIYVSISRAREYLSIITTFSEGSSDIINILTNSSKKST